MMNDPDTTNSQGPAIVQTRRRRSTTVLGVTVLTLAGLCLLGSAFMLLIPKSGHSLFPVPHSTMLVHNALVLLSKIGLVVLGICLVQRQPGTRGVALVSLSVSMTDSAYYLIKVIPPMQFGLHPNLAAAMNVGGWIMLVMPALLYIGILVYLDQTASQKEFESKTN